MADNIIADNSMTEDIVTEDRVATGHMNEPRRRGPDPLALIVGLASVAVAIMAFVGTVVPLPGFDPRWLLAAAAVAIGLMLLGASVRRRR